LLVVFGTSTLVLSEISDPRPIYEVDFSATTTSTAALEFFNAIGQERPVLERMSGQSTFTIFGTQRQEATWTRVKRSIGSPA